MTDVMAVEVALDAAAEMVVVVTMSRAMEVVEAAVVGAMINLLLVAAGVERRVSAAAAGARRCCPFCVLFGRRGGDRVEMIPSRVHVPANHQGASGRTPRSSRRQARLSSVTEEGNFKQSKSFAKSPLAVA